MYKCTHCSTIYNREKRGGNKVFDNKGNLNKLWYFMNVYLDIKYANEIFD